MGAQIIYANEFEERHRSLASREVTELERIGGGIFNMSYASCEELKADCAKLGVASELWPDYIETDGYDIPLQELREKNQKLHSIIAGLSPNERMSVKWLDKIHDILDSGMLFYICH